MEVEASYTFQEEVPEQLDSVWFKPDGRSSHSERFDIGLDHVERLQTSLGLGLEDWLRNRVLYEAGRKIVLLSDLRRRRELGGGRVSPQSDFGRLNSDFMPVQSRRKGL